MNLSAPARPRDRSRIGPAHVERRGAQHLAAPSADAARAPVAVAPVVFLAPEPASGAPASDDPSAGPGPRPPAPSAHPFTTGEAGAR